MHEILPARILEWTAMLSSRGASQPRDRTCVSCGYCTTVCFPVESPERPSETTEAKRGKNIFMTLGSSWQEHIRGKIMRNEIFYCSVVNIRLMIWALIW